MGKMDNEEVMRITARFLAEQESGEQPSLEDYLRRYPQYSDEIVDFVMYYRAFETALPDASASVPTLSEPSRAAFDRAWERAKPTSLSLLAQQQHSSLTKLAAELDLSVDMVEQLAGRQLDPATIPNELVQRLADVLTQSLDVVRQALSGFEPSLPFILAEERAAYTLPPFADQSAPQQSFSAALSSSLYLSTEQRDRWQSIVEREKERKE